MSQQRPPTNSGFFFDSTVLFVNFVAKVLYCLKQSQKNYVIFWTVQCFLLIFLQKCCTVPKKPILFCKSAVLYQKNQKNQFFQVLGPRSAICLSIRLVFLRQYSTFTKKDRFFWDSTVFLLIFLQKCCTVPKTPIFFCKSAVLSQKKPKKNNLFQSCCPARSQDLKRLFFLVFLGQYSTLAKKDWFFFWDSTVFFVNFLAKVLYCPKKNHLFLQKCCTVPKKPILWKACSR